MHTPAMASRFAREDFEALRDALRKISRKDGEEPARDEAWVDELGPHAIPAQPEAARVLDFGLERRKRRKTSGVRR